MASVITKTVRTRTCFIIRDVHTQDAYGACKNIFIGSICISGYGGRISEAGWYKGVLRNISKSKNWKRAMFSRVRVEKFNKDLIKEQNNNGRVQCRKTDG